MIMPVSSFILAKSSLGVIFIRPLGSLPQNCLPVGEADCSRLTVAVVIQVPLKKILCDIVAPMVV
jgi:hypothetical protein